MEERIRSPPFPKIILLEELDSEEGTKQYENFPPIDEAIWETKESGPPPSPTIPDPAIQIESKV